MATAGKLKENGDPALTGLWWNLATGVVTTRAEIDTAHFKAITPTVFLLSVLKPRLKKFLTGGEITWKPLMGETKLKPDHQHFLEKEIQKTGPITHVKLNIYPDGGISRLRLYGSLV